MNLPNLLTLTRVLLIPVFVILILNKSFGWAIITFGIAGITDGIDGLIARLTHQRTELGAYFDPIADKLLLTSAFIILAISDSVPAWLTVIVITRDMVILIGILVMFLTNYRPKIKPSILSKLTTVFQILTILVVLIDAHYAMIRLIPAIVPAIAIFVTAVFTVLSGFHYIYVGAHMLNGKK